MNSGMLWFNNDARLDLDRKVNQAARYFSDKYGCKPDLCYVHPSMLDGRLNDESKEVLTIGDIELRPLKNMRPNHFWVTSNGKDSAWYNLQIRGIQLKTQIIYSEYEPPGVQQVVSTGMDSTFFDADGIRLHVVQEGPEDGPLLILLHGFPEFWYGWKKHIQPFASAGSRVLAPDQRGRNLSDEPRGIASYTIDSMAQDVLALTRAYGREKVHLAGHDWGVWWPGGLCDAVPTIWKGWQL